MSAYQRLTEWATAQGWDSEMIERAFGLPDGNAEIDLTPWIPPVAGTVTVTFTDTHAAITSAIDQTVTLSGDIRDSDNTDLKAGKTSNRKLTGEGYGYVAVNGERFPVPAT